jgi:hypothetical protein
MAAKRAKKKVAAAAAVKLQQSGSSELNPADPTKPVPAEPPEAAL